MSALSRGVICHTTSALLLIVAACDTTPTLTPRPRGEGGAGGSAGAGGGGDGAVRPPAPDAGVGTLRSATAPACAEQAVRKAEPRPVDLLLLVDRSGSMLEKIASGETKWQAMRSAVGAFLTNPKSAGIGVGLQFFPVTHNPFPRIPCSADTDCQLSKCGPIEKHCMEADGSTGRYACNTDAACNGGFDRGARCVPLGRCMVTVQSCFAGGKPCPNAEACVFQRHCGSEELGMCSHVTYRRPAIAIAELPGAAPKIMAALAGINPAAGTPMQPAASGSLAHLKSHVEATPGRHAALVIVSDGLPTNCSESSDWLAASQAVADVLATARAIPPAIPTYIVGIQSPKDMLDFGTVPLDRLAAGGGTGRPFLVSTQQDVAQKLLDAFNAIRGAALPCEYPFAPSDKVDFWHVNVSFTRSTGQTTFFANVRDEASCRPDVGGWYYDRDPRSGGTPSTIVVCPKTCEHLKQDPDGQVDLRLGCKTVYE